jgi:hypothetical protein
LKNRLLYDPGFSSNALTGLAECDFGATYLGQMRENWVPERYANTDKVYKYKIQFHHVRERKMLLTFIMKVQGKQVGKC